MKTLDLLRLSTRMFRLRLMRTMLTILGVSVGIGTIVFLVSLGYGLQTILLERITTSESLLSIDILPPDSDVVTLTPTLINDLKKIPHVEEVVSISVVPAQISVGDSVTDTTGNVASSALFRLSGITPEAGEIYAPEEHDRIVVSSALSELFGWTPQQAVRKSVKLTLFYLPNASSTPHEAPPHYYDVVIRGVVPGDTTLVYVPPSLVPDLPPAYLSQAKARVESADFMESVRSAIVEHNLSVVALFDVVEQANKIFNALQIMLAIFGAAALLVSAIGMFNTMTIAFLERTQEIGIMRAVGASHSDIFSLFLVESGIMGFLGGFGGVLVGYIGEIVVNFGLNLLARSFGGAPIDLFRTPVWLVVIIIAFSTIVGFLTGLLPGRRASKLNPLDALKYK